MRPQPKLSLMEPSPPYVLQKRYLEEGRIMVAAVVELVCRACVMYRVPVLLPQAAAEDRCKSEANATLGI